MALRTGEHFYTGVLQTVTYELPRYKFEACRTFTNKPPCGPKRGHGTPQPRFGQEVQLDKIAEKLRLDPAELRLGMVAKPTFSYRQLAEDRQHRSCRVHPQVVAQSIGKNRSEKRRPGDWPRHIACSSYPYLAPGLPIYWNKLPHSGVQAARRPQRPGHRVLRRPEIGQGSDEVLAAMVAEVLGIDPTRSAA
jgi:CO/xanthine dehydrogenase Mo-binding subunit